MSYKYELKTKCEVELNSIQDTVNKHMEGSARQEVTDSLSAVLTYVERLNNRLNTNIQLYANSVNQYERMKDSYDNEVAQLKERIRILEFRLNQHLVKLEDTRKEKVEANDEAYRLTVENSKLKNTLKQRTDRLTYLEELNQLLLEDYNGQTDNLE